MDGETLQSKQITLQDLKNDILSSSTARNDESLSTYPLSVFDIPKDFEPISLPVSEIQKDDSIRDDESSAWIDEFSFINDVWDSKFENAKKVKKESSSQILLIKCTNCSKPISRKDFEKHSKKCKVSYSKKPAANESSAPSSKPKASHVNLSVKNPDDSNSVLLDSRTFIKDDYTKNSAPSPPHSAADSIDSKKSKAKRGNKSKVLDLDRHCGVIITPSGLNCTRSLTCKSHSMASKRAVTGRTIDFDTLLSRHLSKIQTIKQQAIVSLSEKDEANGVTEIVNPVIKIPLSIPKQQVNPSEDNVQIISISQSKADLTQSVHSEVSLLDAVRFLEPKPQASNKFYDPYQRLNSYYLTSIFEPVLLKNPIMKPFSTINRSSIKESPSLGINPNGTPFKRSESKDIFDDIDQKKKFKKRKDFEKMKKLKKNGM